MDALVAELRKIPPVTRFLCASSLGITIPVLLNIVSPYQTIYSRAHVLQKYEIWRLFTSFFLGSGGINYVFELAMLYRTADELESGPYLRRSADLAYQLLFVGASLIIASTPLSSAIFTRPLLIALTYLSSALAPLGAQTSLMGFVTFPVRYLPYVMIALDFLMAGPYAAAQAVTGALVGHFWWWGVWAGGPRGGPLQNLARAPEWMRHLVGESGAPPPPPPAAPGSGGGVRIFPPRQEDRGSSSGVGGYNWGPGRTLGSS